MLPNQLFNQIGRMNRIIEGMSLLDRLFHRKKPEAAPEPELPDYLNHPNLGSFKKLFEPSDPLPPPDHQR